MVETIEGSCDRRFVPNVGPVVAETDPAARLRQRNQVVACLVGGAIGEMVGGPFDRLPLAAMLARVGGDVTGPTATSRIGDDTQLTLFTVEGIIRAEMRWLDRGLCHPPTVVWNAYRRWGLSQGLALTPGLFPDESSWLSERPELHDRGRASPRCLEVISAGVAGSIDDRINRSDGSAAVMRLAPVGLRWEGAEAARNGAEFAALTHGGDRAIAASAAFAALVAALRSGRPLAAAVNDTVEAASDMPAGDILAPATSKALELARRQPRSAEALHQLGTGRTSLGALLHAIYTLACTDTFEQAILVAVTQDGTSATSASLTGQLAGLTYGLERIPSHWQAICPVRDLIVELAEDWQTVQGSASFGFGVDGSAQRLMRKYPPW